MDSNGLGPDMARCLLGALALASSGCPQLLADDFAVIEAAAGGLGGSGGATAGGGGGTPEAGGAEPIGGMGGNGATAGGGGGSPDGGCLGCSCTWTSFGEPEPITGLELSGSEPAWGPALSPDALTLIFSRGSPEDLFIATRPDRGAAFSAARPLGGGVNTEYDEGTAFVSFDALSLYFFSTRADGNERDLFFSTRPSPAGLFGDAVPIAEVNSGSSEFLPWVSNDARRLHFTSNRAGGQGGYDLWVATRAAEGASFSGLRALAELNTEHNDESASLTANELTLFFTSDRSDSNDVWMASRTSRNEPFSAPVSVSEVNSDDFELNVTVSADGRELFFCSDRPGPSHQLWRATRRCE